MSYRQLLLMWPSFYFQFHVFKWNMVRRHAAAHLLDYTAWIASIASWQWWFFGSICHCLRQLAHTQRVTFFSLFPNFLAWWHHHFGIWEVIVHIYDIYQLDIAKPSSYLPIRKKNGLAMAKHARMVVENHPKCPCACVDEHLLSKMFLFPRISQRHN